MVSRGPPELQASGTAPADIASMIDMPKCSCLLGCLVAEVPKPVACQ